MFQQARVVFYAPSAHSASPYNSCRIQTLSERLFVGRIAVITCIAILEDPPDGMGAVVPDRDDLVLGLREPVFFLGRVFTEGRAQHQDDLVDVESGVPRDDGEVGVAVGIE